MWWTKFIPTVIPTVRAQEEEEVVDPQQVLRDKCSKDHHVKDLHEILETCNARVQGKKETREICLEELVDYLHALDHCVGKDLFKHLK